MTRTPNGTTNLPDISQQWSLGRDEIGRIQLQRLNDLLNVAIEHPFYGNRLSHIELPLTSLDQLSELPLLTKEELVPDQVGSPGHIFCSPSEDYVRYHQTSGTSGHPMPVLDTADDWEWWLQCWMHVLHAAQVTPKDIAMMAFSFGPFIGFWTASDALVRSGALVIPGGGMSSESRLQMIVDHRCTLLCCTPTYALHLLNLATKQGIDLSRSNVSRVIVAGEPGGSSPVIRNRIEKGWGAKVIDHSGASELGAWGFGSQDGAGLHVIETEFIAEFLVFDEQHTLGRKASDGEQSELVLTGLGRLGGPAIRYRTGDIVCGSFAHSHPCKFAYLHGGVLGRSDDMMVIRGVNVFPSSIEAIIREIEPTAEFRIIATKQGDMDRLDIEIEAEQESCLQLENQFQNRLAMRVRVSAIESGTLPTFEAKAKRLIDRR